ncbi:hypothetical protein NKG05_20350 [Oerskovia sp. M15]
MNATSRTARLALALGLFVVSLAGAAPALADEATDAPAPGRPPGPSSPRPQRARTGASRTA